MWAAWATRSARGGGDDFAVHDWHGHLDADLEVELAVGIRAEIHGHVAAGAGRFLIADGVPDDAAGLGDDGGERALLRAAADDG